MNESTFSLDKSIRYCEMVNNYLTTNIDTGVDISKNSIDCIEIYEKNNKLINKVRAIIGILLAILYNTKYNAEIHRISSNMQGIYDSLNKSYGRSFALIQLLNNDKHISADLYEALMYDGHRVESRVEHVKFVIDTIYARELPLKIYIEQLERNTGKSYWECLHITDNNTYNNIVDEALCVIDNDKSIEQWVTKLQIHNNSIKDKIKQEKRREEEEKNIARKNKDKERNQILNESINNILNSHFKYLKYKIFNNIENYKIGKTNRYAICTINSKFDSQALIEIYRFRHTNEIQRLSWSSLVNGIKIINEKQLKELINYIKTNKNILYFEVLDLYSIKQSIINRKEG